jgi:hypothetical protein
MTEDEYLDFLDEYWELFGPIPEQPTPTKTDNMKL